MTQRWVGGKRRAKGGVVREEEGQDWGAKGTESLGGTPVTINLYVEDCDTVFNRAVEAGATVRMPLADQFWGDRYGQVVDPFGHVWSVATHQRDVCEEELAQAARASMGGCSPS